MTGMIKRILSIMLCFVLLMTASSFAAFNDVADESLYKEAIESLSGAGILKGYGNGEFGGKDPLTRAQFAKIVVALSGNEEAAKANNTEVFTDVDKNHWAIGYINVAAALGLITGYPDGSFGADEKITYAQALTVVIRMLGYSEAEVGKNWPNDYINKASELSLTDKLSFGRNDILTREAAAYIIYNSLSAKEGAGSKISKLTKYEDVIIYGVNEINSGIAEDEVLTSGGTFKKGSAYSDEYLGKKVTLRVNTDNEIVMIIPGKQEAKVYTVISGYQDEIETIEGGTVKIDSGSNVYYKGAKVSYPSVSSAITAGSKAYIYGDYIYIESSEKEKTEEKDIDYTLIYDSFGEVLTKVEDVIIYGVNSVNSGIAADEVLTTGGTFKKGSAYSDEYLGKKVTLRVNSDKEIVMITPEEEKNDAYTLLSASGDKIETAETGFFDIDGKIAAYYKGTKSTYEALYPSFMQGSRIYIYDDYIYVEENKLKGPYTVTKDYNQVSEFFGNTDDVTVTIDGEAAKLSDIKRFDVVYFNDITKRLYVYTDRETGIYEKAIPSKENLSGIVLSGTTYSAIDIDAKKKLDDTEGSFKINDRITLLFGRDGSVVDVVDIDGRTLSDMGVLLKAYSLVSSDEETKGKKEYFADIMLASGNKVTYKTDTEYSDKEYKEYTGKFVYIMNNGDGTVKIELAKENRLTGSFDKSVPSYAEHDLQQNYSILELVYSEKYDEAIVRKVNLRDISVSSLGSGDVIHVEYANEMEDIAVIYVNNITFDGYTFGVLNKAVSDGEANYSYELKSSSGTVNYSGSAGWSFVKGEAVMVLAKDGKLKEIYELKEVASATKIDSFTDTKIKVDGKVYAMDDEVSVVYKSIGESEWNMTTLGDLSENLDSGKWKANIISIYADKAKNGKVRVIRVTLK